MTIEGLTRYPVSNERRRAGFLEECRRIIEKENFKAEDFNRFVEIMIKLVGCYGCLDTESCVLSLNSHPALGEKRGRVFTMFRKEMQGNVVSKICSYQELFDKKIPHETIEWGTNIDTPQLTLLIWIEKPEVLDSYLLSRKEGVSIFKTIKGLKPDDVKTCCTKLLEFYREFKK